MNFYEILPYPVRGSGRAQMGPKYAYRQQLQLQILEQLWRVSERLDNVEDKIAGVTHRLPPWQS